jgi:hypothetical protein
MVSQQVAGPPPKLLPGLLGGLFIGVLSALPLVSLANCCCLWVVMGGFLAAWVQQQNHEPPITVFDGALVGLIAGLIGGVVHYMVALPLELILGNFMAGFEGFMGGSRQEMPPELRRLVNELGPQGLLLLGSIFFAGVSLFFGTLGGVLGAIMIKKSPPPPPPTQPSTPAWGAPPPFPGAGAPRRAWPPPPPPPPADDRPREE